MATTTRSWLFRKRVWALAALAAGVMIGARFPSLWPGFGGGGGTGLGGSGRSNTETTDATDTQAETRTVSALKKASPTRRASLPEPAPQVVLLVIADRSFLLRSGDEERPIEIAELIELVKRAEGDSDGIRLRIFREPSSRASAEQALETALADGGIREHEILWVPAGNN